jgi:hypothetical protein
MFDSRSRIACLTFATALLAGGRVARAEESPSDCPQLAEVASRVDQLLVRQTGASAADQIEIRDRGASWEIEVADHQASYADPNRDCAERVRVATVFAALALEPPDREVPVAVVAPPEVPQAAPAPVVRQGLEVAPELVLGLGGSGTATAWGGALRWQISGARLGLGAGLGGMLPAIVRAGPYEAQLARTTFDVSPRARLRAGPASFGLDLGPFVGLLFAKGRNLSPGGSSTSFDAGARLALRVELAWRRISPFLAARGEVGVRRFQMSVEPSGEVGTAPRVWLGMMLGAALGP